MATGPAGLGTPAGLWGHGGHGGDSVMTGLRRHQGARGSDTTSLEPEVTPRWQGPR